MNIALITARIGSKRIKKKNIKSFLGTPIINTVITKLIKTKLFDKIFISTDSNEVEKICYSIKNKEIISIINRPKKLSGDYVGTREVVVDFIKKTSLNINTNLFCIYPTSVFIKKNLLKKLLRF